MSKTLTNTSRKILATSLVLAACAIAISAVITSAQTAGTFNFDVQARNMTIGEAAFADSVSVMAGDRIQFQLRVVAGSTSLNNVIFKNNLPAGLVFASGEPAINSGPGFNAGTVSAAATRTVTFEAIATGGNPITVNNTATARADGTAEKSDSVSVTISNQPVVARNLVVRHTVMNLTRNETTGSSATTANAGDRLRFEVEIEALGNANQTDLQLRYFINSRLAIVSGDPNIFINGVSLGNIQANTKKTVTFEATATGGDAVTVTNTARVWSAEVPQKESTVTVFIRSGSTSAIKNFNLDMRVLNLSRSQTELLDTTVAGTGDRLRFELKVDALGNAPHTNVVLRSTLPERLSFLAGDLNLVSTSGISLGTLSGGASQTITFEAQVNGTIADPITVMATVRSDNVEAVSDSAQVLAVGSVAGASTGQRISVVNRSTGTAAVTSAKPGELLAFTLSYNNTSASPLANFRIEADVRDLMMLARISNTGNPAAVVDAGVIKFPPVTIAAGSSLDRTFEATVMTSGEILAQADRTIVINYGNQVSINVDPAARTTTGTVAGATKGAIVPPRTGASEVLVVLLAALTTAGFGVVRNKNLKIKMENDSVKI